MNVDEEGYDVEGNDDDGDSRAVADIDRSRGDDGTEMLQLHT
jgi:hypothetical protein